MLDREFIDLQQALAGEYSLERELGRGGMGIVYLAREVQLDRLVAIKVLPGELAAQPEVRDRFLREARMAASLSHPNIVPIHRVGESKGFVFFVMSYVNGETLGERLRSRGPLAPAAATRLLREVAWALSYAHGRGIVHRDVKPDNILIESETGRALVSDFGIAQGADDGAGEPGRVMGTAHFMSPEQMESGPLDGRSDLYSLGVVAHVALSGRLPSEDASVPRPLAPIIGRLLRSNPGERFASGEELAEALEAAAAPTRARLPVALRVWTHSQTPLRAVYTAWGGIFTMGFLSQLHRGPRLELLAIAAVGSLPLIPISLFHLRKTYQALSAGYTLRDLRAALAAWQHERRDELAFEYEDAEPTWAQVLRGVSFALLVPFTATLLMSFPHGLVSRVIQAAIAGGTIITITVGSALGVRFIPRGLRSGLVGAMRSVFWNSRAGEWMAKILTPEKKGVADIDYRPTEMALGVAAGELYAALPAAYRDQVPDLPVVVERLEAHAAAARARLEELNVLIAIGGSTPPEMASSRERAKKELADSVAALEAVRLDLLRLHGGATDLKPITTVLEAARDLGEELDRLVRAQSDVGRLIQLDLRPHTPA